MWQSVRQPGPNCCQGPGQVVAKSPRSRRRWPSIMEHHGALEPLLRGTTVPSERAVSPGYVRAFPTMVGQSRTCPALRDGTACSAGPGSTPPCGCAAHRLAHPWSPRPDASPTLFLDGMRPPEGGRASLQRPRALGCGFPTARPEAPDGALLCHRMPPAAPRGPPVTPGPAAHTAARIRGGDFGLSKLSASRATGHTGQGRPA